MSFPRAGRSAAASLMPPAIAFALLLLAWEAYSRLVLDPLPGGSRLLPAPSAVLAAIVTNRDALGPHIRQTVLETALGFALALVTGLLLSLIVDASLFLRRAIYPLLVVSQTIPLLAIAPLFVLWFGFGILPKVFIVALVCFFPIVVAGVDGLRATDPDLIRLFRTFGASRWSIFRQVRFPTSLPSVFSGIKIAVTYSVVGAIWGEYVGAELGLGIFMQRKQHAFDVPAVFAAVVLISVLSVGLFLITTLVERATIPWHFHEREGRAESSGQSTDRR